MTTPRRDFVGSSTRASASVRPTEGTERLTEGEGVVCRTVLPGGLRIITE